MNMESTLETIVSYIPENLDLPGITAELSEYMPSEISFGSMMQFLLYFAVISLVLGTVGRVVLGRRSSLNHALSSVMGILFIYAATICIYCFKPWNLEAFLSPLPFVNFFGEYMILFPIRGIQFTFLCHEILSMVILAFLVNLLDTFLPKGKSIVGWYFFRFLTILFSMGLHLCFHYLECAYFPEFFSTYAPVLLLGLLIGMLLLGILNLILGVMLAVMNPVIGGIYAFFFSNVVGKQLTKAVFTSVILCSLVFLADYLSFSVISITVSSVTACVPFGCALLILWYLIGHIL